VIVFKWRYPNVEFKQTTKSNNDSVSRDAVTRMLGLIMTSL